MEAAKLHLTIWFLKNNLIGQSKIYPRCSTAYKLIYIQNCIVVNSRNMLARSESDESYVLHIKDRIKHAYLGG